MNPGADKPLKQAVIVPNVSVTSLQRGVACLRTVTAQWPRVPSIGQNLKPYTSNGNVSMFSVYSNIFHSYGDVQLPMK